jgi:hypothetical protein
MAAVWMIARSNLRRQALSLLLIAVVGAAAFGFALTAAVGAVRADTAFSRLRDRTLAPHGYVNTSSEDESTGDALRDRLAALDGVAFGRLAYVFVAPRGLEPGVEAGGFVALDESIGRDLYRPHVVEGRLARSDRADEISVNEEMARRMPARVGQVVELRGGSSERPDEPLGQARITGIHRGTFDVTTALGPFFLMTPAFARAHPDLQRGPSLAFVRVTSGSGDLRRVERVVRAAVPGAFVQRVEDEGRLVEDALRVQAIGFALLALVSGAASVLAVAQALRRHIDRAGEDRQTLATLGLMTRQRQFVFALPCLLAAALAAVAGAAVSVVASPVVPVGLASRVDPESGVVFIPAVVIGLGLLAFVATTAAMAPALRVAVARADRPRRRPVPGPLTMALGVEPVLGGSTTGARRAARSAAAAAVAGVAGIVAVGVFAASLDRLERDPVLQGWAADGTVSSEETDLETMRAAASSLESDRRVRRVVWGSVAPVPAGRDQLEILGLDGAGSLHPTMLRGRAPEADDEIALSPFLVRRLDAGVGETVSVDGARGRVRLRVVGVAAFPGVGANGDVETTASMTRDGLLALGVDPVQTIAFLDLHRSVDMAAVASAHQPEDGSFEVLEPFEPPRVKNLREVGAMPAALTAFLAALFLAGFVHGLTVSVRRRRHDLAVLRALGMRRADVRRTVHWQATATAAAGLVVGGVVGLSLGRVAWRTLAAATGILSRPQVDSELVLLGALAVLAVANVAAAVPARLATRLKPATVLAAE